MASLVDISAGLLATAVTYRLVFKGGFTLLLTFLKWVIYPALGWTIDFDKYASKWAVLTGCTDGIGREYTLALARKGFTKFLLIGRNLSKLDVLKSELLMISPSISTKMMIVDFSVDKFTEQQEFLISSLNTGLLVNCAGIAVDQIAPFDCHPQGLASKIIQVNVVPAVRLIELVLPRMLQEDCGVIVNVASALGFRPLPYTSSYSCSKATLSFLAQSLAQEYAHTNVHFQSLLPFVVATKMSKYNDNQADGFLVLSARNYATQAVNSLGITSFTSGCVQHDLVAIAAHIVPNWLSMLALRPVWAYQRRRMRANKNGVVLGKKVIRMNEYY